MLAAVAPAFFLAAQVSAPAEPAGTTNTVQPTRLVYVTGVFSTLCPSEADVRARVVQNLGLDPFIEPAERIALLVVEGEPGSDETPPRVTGARLELVDADYQSLGARALSGDERCDELVAAAALALAIAIDPTRALLPPEPLPAADAAPRPFLMQPRVIVRRAPERVDPIEKMLLPGTRVTASVGGHGAVLLTPGTQGGAHVGATWRGSWWGLGAELRNDTPFGQAAGAALLTALPCAHVAFADIRAADALALKACTTTTLGAAWSLETPLSGGPYLGLGGRLGVEWMMADASAVGLWTQLEWGVVRPTFTTGGAPVNLALGATFELGWPQ